MIYEFITPSDAITFRAIDDKVAYCVTVIVGHGHAGCQREDGESLPTLIIFSNDLDKEIESYLGVGLVEYSKQEKDAIAEALESFAYGSVSERKTYDDAIEAITDPEKLQDFKEKHEDRNRTSLSRWVQSAWNYANKIKAA